MEGESRQNFKKNILEIPTVLGTKVRPLLSAITAKKKEISEATEKIGNIINEIYDKLEAEAQKERAEILAAEKAAAQSAKEDDKKDENKDISVEESLFIEDDLRLSLDAQTKDTEKIKEDVSQDKLIITFDYHGNLPLETTVRINVQDKFKDNERLYLYYYNPELDQIEYIAHNVLVKDGYVEFELEHCSDYFLTAAVVNDAVNNPQSVNYIIIGLIVVVFILVAVTLFQSKK